MLHIMLCDGMPHGQLEWKTNDTVTEVEYVNGVAQQGTVNSKNGSFYKGEIKDWKPHGSGEFRYPDGRRYRGQFSNGVPDGSGELTLRQRYLEIVGKFAGGEVLNGTWSEGKENGQFQMTTDVGVTEISYVNGVPACTGKIKYNVGIISRSGTVTYSDGRWYKGEIKDFNAHGRGVLMADNGSWEYRGEFAADKQWGIGVYRYSGDRSLKSVYAGAWQEDEKHGHGIEGNGVEGNIAAAVLYEKGKLLSTTPVVPLTLEEEWHLAWQLYRDATAPDCSAPVDSMMEEYLENVERDVLGPMLAALTAREAELAASGAAVDDPVWDAVRRALDRAKKLASQRDDVQTYLQAVRWVTSLHEQEQNVGRKKGIYRTPCGDLYEGMLQDGIPRGFGIVTCPSGEVHGSIFLDPHTALEYSNQTSKRTIYNLTFKLLPESKFFGKRLFNIFLDLCRNHILIVFALIVAVCVGVVGRWLLFRFRMSSETFFSAFNGEPWFGGRSKLHTRFPYRTSTMVYCDSLACTGLRLRLHVRLRAAATTLSCQRIVTHPCTTVLELNSSVSTFWFYFAAWGIFYRTK